MSLLGEDKMAEAERVVDESLAKVSQIDKKKGLEVSYLDLLFKNYKAQFVLAQGMF